MNTSERLPLALLVEDDKDACEIYSTFLVHRGFQVVTADSAPAAFDGTRQTGIMTPLRVVAAHVAPIIERTGGPWRCNGPRVPYAAAFGCNRITPPSSRLVAPPAPALCGWPSRAYGAGAGWCPPPVANV